jgi:hypothetical protein
MQFGMIAGFATSWPADAWLIRHCMKEAMSALGASPREPPLGTP